MPLPDATDPLPTTPEEVSWIATASPAARDRTALAAAGLLAALYAVRLSLLGRIGLFSDEAYYWEYSRRLALSYFDHPPFVAWCIALCTRAFGDGPAAIHATALVFSALTTAALFKLVRRLFPDRPALAWWSALALQSMPLFALGATFTTPDAPCAFFWVGAAYLSFVAAEGSRRHWYLAGLCAGLGFLSKYNLVLLPPAILLFLALSPRHRHWLRKKEPYLAMGIMAACAIPVVVWNAEHHWASFTFHLVERHSHQFRPLLNLGRLLAAQQAVSPPLWIASLAGAFRSYRLARRGDAAHKFLLCVSGVILAFFFVIGLFALVNPNWFIFGFSTLLVCGVDALLALRSRIPASLVVGFGIAVCCAFYVQAVTLALPLPPGLDFAVDLNGWPEVGGRLGSLRASMPHPDRVFIFSRRFQFSALAAYYGGDDARVTRLGGRMDQYDLWRPEGEWDGWDAIFLSAEPFLFDPRQQYPFRSCEPAGDWELVRGGRRVRTFQFWRCFDYRPSR